MNALAKDVAHYASLPEAERASRIRHEQQFETRIKRSGLTEVSWKCTHCRAGRVTVVAHRDVRGTLISTSGQCSTPGCLDWGNS